MHLSLPQTKTMALPIERKLFDIGQWHNLVFRLTNVALGFFIVSYICHCYYKHENEKHKDLNAILLRIANKWNSRLNTKRLTLKTHCGYMTTKWPYGRLGIKMSTLAALYSISQRNLKYPYIHPATQLESINEIFDIDFLTNAPILESNQSNLLKSNCTFCFMGAKAARTPCGNNIRLEGYFSHPNYYHALYQKHIFRLFTFKNPILYNCLTIIRQNLRPLFADKNVSNCILIGVHARRGDKVTQALRKEKYGKRPASADYIRRAMQLYEQKFPGRCLLYLILGDDLAWNMKLTEPGKWNVLPLVPSTPEVDMCILASTDHFIMTYGTFSYWSAYLAGGDVIVQANCPDKLDTWTSLSPCTQNNMTVLELSESPECWPRNGLPHHIRRSCEYNMLHEMNTQQENCYPPDRIVQWRLENDSNAL